MRKYTCYAKDFNVLGMSFSVMFNDMVIILLRIVLLY